MRNYSVFTAFIILLFYWSGHVLAASFNCNEASRTQEKFICENEDISQLDGAMAKAYREQMKVLPKYAQSLVQASHRSWLNYWPKNCSAQPGSLKFDANSKACVLEAYRARMSELSAFNSIEGLTTFKVSEYRYLAPKNADDPPTTHTISFPQVVAQYLNEGALNGWLAIDLNKWRSSLDVHSNTETYIFLSAPNINLLQATEVHYFYGHGAAHPITSKVNHYFIPSAARAMNASDFFADNAWTSVVAEFIFKKLQQKLGDNLQIEMAKELIPSIRNTANWSISKNAFSLEFNPYEVAPYSEGFVEVQVPLSLLRPYLTRYARDTVGSK